MKENLKRLFRRKSVRASVVVTAFLLLFVLFCNLLVILSASPRRTTPEALQESGARFDCILVPGALVRPGGELSLVLRDRMDMGLTLLQNGYADLLLLSGDAEEPAVYDEVGAMAAYAVNAGAEDTRILQDPLGLSTYESLWRAKNVYHVQSVLIVTQSFHLSRALYLADRLGLDCAGVACDVRAYSAKNQLRESAARIKAVFDGLFLPEP